jgi:hypothetical protein
LSRRRKKFLGLIQLMVMAWLVACQSSNQLVPKRYFDENEFVATDAVDQQILECRKSQNRQLASICAERIYGDGLLASQAKSVSPEVHNQYCGKLARTIYPKELYGESSRILDLEFRRSCVGTQAENLAH